MAITFGNLWPAMVSWENLVAAYRRCRRGKRSKPEAAQFDFAWESELLQLQRELEDGVYEPGEYRNFYIHEPKRRKISAAPFRDRIVHHALVRVLEPIYEPRFLSDSYACRRGKGTHRAILRAQQYLRRHEYCLKTDIVRFFPNVDHEVLAQIIRRRVCDRRILALIDRIIASGEGVLRDEGTNTYFPGDDLFAVSRPKGLPIGNLTSQFFANVLLDPVDHFVKEDLRVPGYLRYADDLLLFGANKQQLWDWRDALGERLAALRLRLHAGKTQVRPTSCKLKYLGLVLQRDGRRIQQSTLTRLSRRLRRWRWLWKHGVANSKELRHSLAATASHGSFANSRGVLRDIWRRARFRRGDR